MELQCRNTIIVLLILVMMSSCVPTSGSRTVSSPVSGATITMISPSPQDTIRPTASNTITFMPALPAEEAEAKVLELLSDNGGCRLPCFWGFTPGQANVYTIRSFLYAFRDFSLSDYLFGDTGGGGSISISRDDLMLDTQLTVGGVVDAQPDIVGWIMVDMIAYHRVALPDGYEDRKVFDSPYFAEYFQYYSLPNLLSTYGPPANAYISFENEQYTYEYYLYLDYTESGWVAMFTMPLGWRGDFEVLVGCPSEAFTTLWLWAPGNIEVARGFGFADGTLLKSVEEATSYTLEEFYQQFKNPANTECLETPINIYEP